MNESGPNCLTMSVVNASEPLPDNVRRITSGKISGGKRVALSIGRRAFVSMSIAPDARNIPMATPIS